jgi:hypothetical protein
MNTFWKTQDSPAVVNLVTGDDDMELFGDC